MFAAFLKLIVPILVVVPGIAAFVITTDPTLMAGLGTMAQEHIPTLAQADKAYPWLTQFLPIGAKRGCVCSTGSSYRFFFSFHA